MFKLLANYVKEQKTNLVQVFGLGFLIIIMVSSFLSLNFATNYVVDQYWKDIAKEEFHQEINFDIYPKFKNGYIKETWLNNLSYINEKNEIEKEKMTHSTFQIRKLPEYNEKNNLYLYRFFFEKNDSDVHVGCKFAKETKHSYVDFKISVPFNYPSIEKHDEFLQQQAKIINAYVYDEKDSSTNNNKTVLFITNRNALYYYNNNIKNIEPWATRDYDETDIENQAKLYQLLVMGMLYGDNLSWTRTFYLDDYLIGKKISFIQTTKQDKVNTPILVDNNKNNFDWKDLKDDEILIYKEFAKENNLNIGQNYVFAGYNFYIAGFATSALAANSSSYFWETSDNKNQTVAFVNQATMNKILPNPYTKISQNNFLAFNPEISSKSITDSINNEWIYQYFHQKLINNEKIDKSLMYFAIKNGVQNDLFLNPFDSREDIKTQAMEVIVWKDINFLKETFLQIGLVFLVLIFIVIAIIIFIVIFKMIDRNKRLIGILKAHGYPSWKLNFSLVISTIFPMLLFAILGSILAILFGHFIVATYSTGIILVNYGWPFYYQMTLLIIFIPFIMLLLINFIMIFFLLRINTLTLINNNWSKNKYNFNISIFFNLLASKAIKKVNFYNKLAIITTFRSFGKMFFVIIVSIFASVLLLFSFSSSGLVRNLLGLQFASINYKYNIKYNFDRTIRTNFISDNNQLLYKKENINDIKSKPSLYLSIKNAINEIIKDPKTPKLIDFRYGYIMGSELYKIREEIIEPNLTELPIEFQKFWNQNIYFIDYLTNDNGKKETDLMVNFGLLPFNLKFENPYTEINFQDAHDFDINTIDTNNYYYDEDKDILCGDWSKLEGSPKIAAGVNNLSYKYLTPGLKNSKFVDFTNLTLENMIDSNSWLNNNFINIRNLIIKKFNIKNPLTSSVEIVPMVGSIISKEQGIIEGDGDRIGKTVLYRYRGMDLKIKYIIGVTYDIARNLLQDTILMPELWLNQAIFGNNINLAPYFSNTKFTNFNNSELFQYLPILSKENDYWIDLTKIIDKNYLEEKGIIQGLTMIYDIGAIRDIFQSRQYSLQIVIFLFGFFSVILSFMIIIIISNINIRDNLVLVNILSSLGYYYSEISYVFLITTVPILIIFSLFAIFIAPILTGFLAKIISDFLSMKILVIFKWWYFALMLLLVFLIYFISYIITWSLNVKRKNLMNLTK